MTVDRWPKPGRSFPTALAFQKFLRLKLRFLKLETHHCCLFGKCLSAHLFFVNLIRIQCLAIHKLCSFQILCNFDAHWQWCSRIPSHLSFLRTTLSSNQRNSLKTLDYLAWDVCADQSVRLFQAISRCGLIFASR